MTNTVVCKSIYVLLLALFAFAMSLNSVTANTYSEAIEMNKRAVKALNKRDWNVAIEMFREALKLDPRNQIALRNLSIAHNNFALQIQSKPTESLKHFHKALFIDPTNKTTIANLNGIIKSMGRNPNSFEDRVDLGDLAKRNKDLVGSLIEYKAAIKLKDDISTRKKLKSLVAELEKNSILDPFEKVILGQDNKYSTLYRATSSFNKSDYKKAIAEFTKLIDGDRNNIDLYVKRAQAKYLINDLEGAIQDYSAVIKLEPDNPGAFASRAYLKEKFGDHDGAKLDYQQEKSIRYRNSRKSFNH